jgi:hypothetical protein
MGKADTYRQKAAEFRERATTARDPVTVQLLLRLADRYAERATREAHEEARQAGKDPPAGPEC